MTSNSYWSTANGDDTMVTLWNPADEAQNLVFTLFFAGGSYRYPVPLGPRATRTFNVSEIIQSQIPDENGNTIPAGVHEGSAEIAGIQAEQEHILVAMAAGTYNVRKATCAGSCITCNGYTGVDEFDFLDGSIPVGSSTTVTFALLNNSGTYVNVSNSSTWSSSNSGIATVNTPGTAGGVAAGSFTAYATSSYQPEYSKFVCPTGDSVNCPEKEFQSSGQGVVLPKPTVTSVTFSNGLVLGVGGVMTVTGQNFDSFLGSISVNFGSGITTSGATVQSNTTITASYQVTCAAPLGSQTFTITSQGGDGVAAASSTPWTVNVSLPAAPMPTIKLGGNSISGTQSVVVGQQIALSGSASLPPCMSRSSELWTPSSSSSAGTPIGGYAASASSGAVTPLQPPTTPGSIYTFYWVYPSNGVSATYQYTMSGGGASVSSPLPSHNRHASAMRRRNVSPLLGLWQYCRNFLLGDSGRHMGNFFYSFRSAGRRQLLLHTTNQQRR